MDYRANALKSLEQTTVRRRIRGGPQRAFDCFPLKINDHHVLGPHPGVVHPAGFDRKNPASWISYADIAKRQIDQFIFWQQQVGLITLFLDLTIIAHSGVLASLCADHGLAFKDALGPALADSKFRYYAAAA